MTSSVRLATKDDLPTIVEMTRAARQQRAAWEPEYFRVAAGADERHQAYLAGLIESDDAVVRVVTDGERVVGCAFAVRKGDRWVVDDIAPADDGWWSDGMIELLRAVKERPTLACIPRRDVRAAGCCTTVGLRLRSSYWRRALTAGDGKQVDGVTDVAPPEVLRGPPFHAFGTIDPAADDVTLLGDGTGYAVLAPPAAAPPVYDPGGTTGLVERVTGGRRGDLVDVATARSTERDDVQLVVVCSEDDPVLEDVLVDRGFARVVDVYTWPDLA